MPMCAYSGHAAAGQRRLAHMPSVSRRYVQHINRHDRRTGTLWEGRYKASPFEAEEYLMEWYRYIELNPVRAQGMADTPGTYPCSGYRASAHGRDGTCLVPHPLSTALGGTPSERQSACQVLSSEHLDAVTARQIRQRATQAVVLGSESFRTRIENALDIPARPVRRGRPQKNREAINHV